jgi:hypothetical protein
MKTRLAIVSVKPLAWVTLNLFIGLGIVALAQPSLAQTANPNTTVDPFQDTQSGDALTNLFNNRNDGSGATSGVFDLIQRITGGSSQVDFQAQQQQNLDDAAAQFRAQQQLLLRQQQPAPATQVVPPVKPATP